MRDYRPREISPGVIAPGAEKKDSYLDISLHDYDALVFDLDGVITDTASTHFAAWKEIFDIFLQNTQGSDFEPFTKEDYRSYVDGLPRLEGIASFLEARGIKLSAEEIFELGERKNKVFREHLKNGEFDVFEPAMEFVREARQQGLKTAIVSSSKNACLILHLVGIADLFDLRIDGITLERENITGKPSPDMFLAAAKRLGVNPRRAVVFEDAEAGVEAGRKGGFGLVIGIAHDDPHANALLEHGADSVVDSFAEIRLGGSRNKKQLPDARNFVDHIAIGDMALFLSYDGCLKTKSSGAVSKRSYDIVKSLARHCSVVIVSGRDVDELRERVGIDGIIYVGSHGFDIVDVDGNRIDPGHGDAYLPVLALVFVELRRYLKNIKGVRLEQKRFSIVVDWQNVSQEHIATIEHHIETALAEHPELTYTRGIKEFFVVPHMPWDEGYAVDFVLAHLTKEQPAIAPVFVGDASSGAPIFRVLKSRGMSVVVSEASSTHQAARYNLPDKSAVLEFLDAVNNRIERVAHEHQWVLHYDHYDPKKQGVREALCTLANGYFATRGAAAEADPRHAYHYPATYIAGAYNRLWTRRAGNEIENEDLVNFPNWLSLKFRVQGDEWFELDEVDIHDYDQRLDLKKGLLNRSVVFQDKAGRTTRLEESRLVHMGDMHLAGLRMEICALDWSGTLEIRSSLDGRVVNDNVLGHRGLRKKHLEILALDEHDDETIHLRVRTCQSRIEVAQAARTSIYKNNELISPARKTIKDPQGLVGHQLAVYVDSGESLAVEKIVAIYTSRDRAISESSYNACKKVHRAGRFQEILFTHVLAWSHIWRQFDIGLVSEERLPDGQHPTLILRLHIFHLVQTASPLNYDLDVGIPARGWHGEGYRGHVFWDELFVFPLLNLRAPDVTRALLLYRYRRLEEARARAQELGHRGAMYPWQSGSEGREETPMLHYDPERQLWMKELSWMQSHISADVAYNVWQYYLVTADIEFLDRYGSEIILEVARYFASISTYNAHLDRYEIWNVVGPDEYQTSYPGADKPGLRNNAYTNIMAVWVMNTALEILDLLPPHRVAELCERLQVSHFEIETWETISKKMRILFFEDGIISQFEGYESLEEFDWEHYRARYGDLQKVHAILDTEGKSLNDYKVSKQADVLMLFYLFSNHELKRIFGRLGYDFEDEMVTKNIAYYMKRTAHGSTLSRIVHSWVLARTDKSKAWRIFAEALLSDVADIQGGTTSEGIHLGAMAGTVDIVERSFAGVEIRGDVLYFKPKLPDEVQCLNLNIRYRGHILAVDIDGQTLRITTAGSNAPAIRVGYGSEVVEMSAFESRCFDLGESGESGETSAESSIKR